MIAIYLRISREDIGLGDESTSISNQRILIMDYIKNNQELRRQEVKEYCDDGYSGTNTDRPDFARLMNDLKKGEVSCVVVKDFSRFSRDYIEVGTYITRIFPFMKVRFIAINDRYDSISEAAGTFSLDMQFKTLLNDVYVKDSSAKSRLSIQNRLLKGEYVFNHVPMGYQKSKTEKNKIEINPVEAKVVRYIIDLALDNKGHTEIARILHRENIPTCSELRKTKLRDGEYKRSWDPSYISIILKNPFYTGYMVVGKTCRRTVGESRNSYVPMEERILIPNHHPALMTEDEFAIVSRSRSYHTSKASKNRRHPLIGKIRCGECGYAMTYNDGGKKNAAKIFLCEHGAVTEESNCCRKLDCVILDELILYRLNYELQLRMDSIKQQELILDTLNRQKSGMAKEQISTLEELNRIPTEQRKLFERYATKQMTAAEYTRSKRELEQNKEILTEKLQLLQDKRDEIECLDRRYQGVKGVLRFIGATELTRELVDRFIQKVVVYGGNRIEIQWNFSECDS